MLGEHEIEIHLQSDLNVMIRIEVISDGEPPAIIETEDEDEAAGDEENTTEEPAQDDADTE
jgi:hypothetical protein